MNPNPNSVRRSTWSLTLALSVGFSLMAAIGILSMIVLFVWQSLPLWQKEGWDWVTGTRWFYRHQLFGAAPMLFGTVMVALVALTLATPIGLGAAFFTAEFLPKRLRLAVKIAIELLAGVPSVVYGLLGILLLRDWVYAMLQDFDPLSGDTLLTAGLLLAVMILPTIMTLADEALRGVPASQRLAARGLGLNATEVVLHVSLPQAWPGLVAAVLLSLGRALGEMIAVFLVVGRQDNQWPPALRLLVEPGQTLASKLGSAETNIALGDPLHFGAMAGIGLLLLLLVLGLTLAGLQFQRSRPHAS